MASHHNIGDLISSFLGSSTEASDQNEIDAISQAIQNGGRIEKTLPRNKDLMVLCFSKDRPFQLQQYLRSFHLFGRKEHEETKVEVVVLWTASNVEMERLYEIVEKEFHWVRFEKETCFHDQLRGIICESEQDYILFGVDDAVFFRRFHLGDAIETFITDPTVCVFHLKLSKGMNYCHPAQAAMIPPQEDQFLTIGESTTCTFPLSHGTYDWDYPWDLCGSMYRKKDVMRVLELLKPEEYAHPNMFEVNGSRVFAKRGKRAGMYCGAQVMAVVTVNRVQDVYENPVYHEAEEPDLDLNPFLGSKQFALWAFQAQTFDRVHVGFCEMEDLLEDGKISVLIPFHNAERFLEPCVKSVVANGNLVGEIILVNDRSSDNGVAIAERLGKEYDLKIIHVANHEQEIQGLVAFALNEGLVHVRSKLVARMDVDDICCKTRLEKQAEFLRMHPKIAGVGSGAYFVDDQDMPLDGTFRAPDDALMKQVPIVHGPAFVEWTLHFYCCLLHPTMLLHQSFLLQSFGYREDRQAEDYDLWLRGVASGCKFDNIMEPLLLLRISPQSVTSEQSLEQKRDLQARTVLNELVQRGLLLPNQLKVVHALQFNQGNDQAAIACQCAKLLLNLETLVSEIAENEHEIANIDQDCAKRLQELAIASNEQFIFDALQKHKNITKLKCFQQAS